MKILNLKASDDESSSSSTPKLTGRADAPKKNQITDLKSGVHDQSRVNVFVDGEFCFSLDLAQIVDHRLKIGKILTPAEITELRHASVFGKLYMQTLEWVLARPRSIKETRDHLSQRLAKLEIENRHRAENRERSELDPEFKKLAREHKIGTSTRDVFTKDDIEKVIEQLIDKNYLDDRKFAEWYIENRFTSKGVSPLRLRQELYKKGIESNLIDEMLENSPRDEAAEIRKVIQKRGNKTDAKKLLGYLLRHGFSIDLSRELVAEYYGNLAEGPELVV
ncbi:RecX family transcriptional regulator [Candidatus Saccharibacteria bacterium]|nr:RecX family transcriptional regulator [Candidatus Saccharibacteria bacterium]